MNSTIFMTSPIIYHLYFVLRVRELRFSLLDEGLDSLLSVSVLEVVRHHPPPLLVGGGQRELQLSLVELLAQTDDPTEQTHGGDIQIYLNI